MATKNDDEGNVASLLITQFTAAVEKMAAAQPPRTINFSDLDYQAHLKAITKVFPRPVFQNNFDADPAGESDETLAKIADIRPGKYLGGVVTVEPMPDNGINFRYSNKTPDHRMALNRAFVSFADLVDKVWAEGQRVKVA